MKLKRGRYLLDFEELPNDYVKIHSYRRLPRGQAPPADAVTSHFALITDDDGTVTGVEIGDKEYRVQNPRRVFGYSEQEDPTS